MTDRTVVPGSATSVTDNWSYAVWSPSVAATVIVVGPKVDGTDRFQLPLESAFVDAIAAVPPAAPLASASTRASGAVVLGDLHREACRRSCSGRTVR